MGFDLEVFFKGLLLKLSALEDADKVVSDTHAWVLEEMKYAKECGAIR